MRHAELEEVRLLALQAAKAAERILLERQATLTGLSEITNASLLTENQALSGLVRQFREVLIAHGLMK